MDDHAKILFAEWQWCICVGHSSDFRLYRAVSTVRHVLYGFELSFRHGIAPAGVAAVQVSQRQRRLTCSRIHHGRTLCWTALGQRPDFPPPNLSNLWEAWGQPRLPPLGQGLVTSSGPRRRGPLGLSAPCHLDWHRPLLARMRCTSAPRSLPCSCRWAGNRAKPLSKTPLSESPAPVFSLHGIVRRSLWGSVQFVYAMLVG